MAECNEALDAAKKLIASQDKLINLQKQENEQLRKMIALQKELLNVLKERIKR